jgi:4'-phosphopantetheinyl transferase
MKLIIKFNNAFLAQPPLYLSKGRIQLWLLNLDAEADDSFCRACLSAEELKKTREVISPKLAGRYMRSHGLLRHILASYLRTAPERLYFATTAYGKPFLRNSTLNFNLSHSEGTAAIAICRHREIGVDIEALRPVPEAFGIARRWFSAAENEWIRVSPEPERAFLRCWVCREALLKAAGQGLATALDSVSLRVEGNALLHDGPYFLGEVKPLPGFVVAVACRTAYGAKRGMPESSRRRLCATFRRPLFLRTEHSQSANRKERP